MDCGAEINVIDRDFAMAINIGISNTKQVAQAANKLPLDVVGQTMIPVSIQCFTNLGLKPIHLGLMLVVSNLGVDCLIGEPGKAQNNLICFPQQKLVVFGNEPVSCYAHYNNKQQPYVLARAQKNVSLLPGEQIKFELPTEFNTISHVAITPRTDTLSWLLPSVVESVGGYVYLTNSSQKPIKVDKSLHMADIRGTKEYELPKQLMFRKNIKHHDTFQHTTIAEMQDPPEAHLELLQVDPDGILTKEERDIFHSLHKRFAHIFTPQPGRYNGNFGHVDNKLQFSSPPPPNSKTHIPNYSPTMNRILAAKMDQLEEWGILAEPEALGISVEYVSPSLLVPKPEPGEFRVVTDFSSLNVYFKRVPNTSATMAQARSRIAKANFVIHLDFSHYFFQNGMQKCDIKYLGTVHPYKGLRVYTCDPQGLKGASERSYEKLLRIFGDLVQDGRVAQMADGMHILGNTVQDLADNYVEVLNRAENCHFTFKPSN